MEMTGEQLIPASQLETWAALNDPEMLKSCIPGCETIDRMSETEYALLMTARIGPVSAKFKGKLSLADLDPPRSYSLAFEGQGGVAGFGKGRAQVQLEPQDEGTRLSYTVKANVGGKLAQVGSRLIDAAAKKLADEFFGAFNAKVASLHGVPAEPALAAHAPGPAPRDAELPSVSATTLAWIAAGALLVALVALIVVLNG